MSHRTGLCRGISKQSRVHLLIDTVKGDIPTVHNLLDQCDRMKQNFCRIIFFELFDQVIHGTKAVIIVDHLRDQTFLHTKVAVIDICDICHSLRQEIHFLLTLFLHKLQLVFHIADHKTYDKDFCNPHIRIIIRHYLNSRFLIHLSKQIARRGKQSRKRGLPLSMHNCK